jgi:flagellum-specific ATP synthase
MTALAACRAQLSGAPLHRRLGWVRRVQGLAIQAEGPDAGLGSLCRIACAGAGPQGLLTEVVGLQPGHVTLMAYGATEGILPGAEVVALHRREEVPVGDRLLGRVIDGFGRALDGGADLASPPFAPLAPPPANPMQRPRIRDVLETGVRVVDGLLPIGRGQRVGIFAGSGVGKSTLLGMLTRHVRSDVNVVALVGERSREVREFIEQHLGPQGLARSVVVVSTAQEAAPARVRAARAAVAIAGWFRERGQHVLLTMDSITRLAMASREIGLAAGEPPTARGYTPSVFAQLPQLCERFGTAPSGGSITALLTVLVEGGDLDEPIADALRAVLDGHVVLSRTLAQQGHYPAVDVLQSASRLLPDIATAAEQALVAEAVRLLALLERHRPMVDLGAYQGGSNPALDLALQREPALLAWLRQSGGGCGRAESVRALAQALEGSVPP